MPTSWCDKTIDELKAETSALRDLLRRFRDYAADTHNPNTPFPINCGGAHHNPIWAEVAEAIGES